ncbi:MAG: hypothetical protein HC859_00760 [Bacteroidia bacterium]|nr:hypothetical protein [Bacteroidia bacterium]
MNTWLTVLATLVVCTTGVAQVLADFETPGYFAVAHADRCRSATQP